MRKTSKKNVTTEVIKKHIYDNIKEYAIASILFIIGIILGVIFINNDNDLQITQITNYLSNFSGSLQTDYEIDNLEKAVDDILQKYEKEKLDNRKQEILKQLEIEEDVDKKKELGKELSNIIITLAKIK